MINKALVVDDDEMVLTFLNTLLTKKFGLRVATAKDGYEGLEELKKGGIDIIFLDILMPRLDGVGFLEIVKNDFQFNHIPVVIVSANSHKETVAKLVKLGIKDYILKPLEFMKITTKLHDLFLQYE
jgi:CheY-like chemotaxis protein